jgi:hypothetical protein
MGGPHLTHCKRFHIVIFITLMEICCWFLGDFEPTWGDSSSWSPFSSWPSIFRWCNVPIFGFPYVTVWDACQSSQLGVIVSSGGFEEFYGARLTLFIIFHHQDPFRTACPWFHCIPTIPIKRGYYWAYFN